MSITMDFNYIPQKYDIKKKKKRNRKEYPLAQKYDRKRIEYFLDLLSGPESNSLNPVQEDKRVPVYNNNNNNNNYYNIYSSDDNFTEGGMSFTEDERDEDSFGPDSGFSLAPDPMLDIAHPSNKNFRNNGMMTTNQQHIPPKLSRRSSSLESESMEGNELMTGMVVKLDTTTSAQTKLTDRDRLYTYEDQLSLNDSTAGTSISYSVSTQYTGYSSKSMDLKARKREIENRSHRVLQT